MWSLDEKRSFSATDAVDWLKSESKVEKTSYGTVQENAGDHNAQRLTGQNHWVGLVHGSKILTRFHL